MTSPGVETLPSRRSENRDGGELFDNWCDPVEGTAFRGGKNASMKPEKSASVCK
jgi:hypothetical protein